MRRSANALLVVLSLALSACGGEDIAVTEPVRAIRAAKIADPADLVGRWYPGRTKAKQEVDLAFEVEARMIERPIKVGQQVEEGQILARLDPRDYQNALDAAEAQLEQATAYQERIAKAAATGAVSQQELTDANARLDVARANVAVQTKALADTTIHAPFAGVVAATYIENFQNVRRKQPVVRLLDTTQIEIEVALPENLISLASLVESVLCRFDAFPGKLVEGWIHEIGTEASAATRTYALTVRVDQPDDFDLLAGMTSEVTVKEGTFPQNALDGGVFVPATAVFSEDAETTLVWLYDESSGTVHKHEVQHLGLSPFGVRVTGLEPGQWIATAGVHFLTEGQTVRLLEDATEVSR